MLVFAKEEILFLSLSKNKLILPYMDIFSYKFNNDAIPCRYLEIYNRIMDIDINKYLDEHRKGSGICYTINVPLDIDFLSFMGVSISPINNPDDIYYFVDSKGSDKKIEDLDSRLDYMIDMRKVIDSEVGDNDSWYIKVSDRDILKLFVEFEYECFFENDDLNLLSQGLGIKWDVGE